jgi:hypothetical protein
MLNEAKDGFVVLHIVGQVAATAGGQGAVINNSGQDLMIQKALINITTIATGVGTLSIVSGAATPTTGGTDVLNTQDVHGVSGWVNCFVVNNTGKSTPVPAVWAQGTYLNFTGSADLTGLVADLFLDILR